MDICIIKLGADGDVLRTIPLAAALKRKYYGSRITWITKGDVASLLKENNNIDEVKDINISGSERFDILYNFDVEEQATQIVERINAEKKYGFGADGSYPVALNIGAEYYLNTMFDDTLKKENRKTYQEMMFEAAELEFDDKRYEMVLKEEDKKYAENFVKIKGIRTKKLIGIHMGASSRWPSKAWHEENIEKFIKLANDKNYDVLLFGGPNESERMSRFVERLGKQGLRVHGNNPNNTKREFAALVNLCDVMVCSDSLSLHVSIALGKKTIGLFFCTSPHEVEGYGLLTKLVSPMLKDFFPERMNEYDENLVKSISPEQVLSAVENVHNNK